VALSYALPMGEPAPHGPYRRAVGSIGAPYPRSASKGRWAWQALARPTRRLERHPLDTAHRSTLEGPARTLPSLPNLPSSFSGVDRGRGPGRRARSSSPRPRGARADRPLGVLHRRVRSLWPKKGGLRGKDQAGQRYEDHGVFRRLFYSSRPPHTERVLRRTKSPLLERLWRAAF